jgi:hypothetical protein
VAYQKNENWKDDLVRKLGLEEIVQLTNKVGLDYVEAKQKAEELEILKPVRRAQAMAKYDNGKNSEAKIKRLAEADEHYVEFLLTLAKSKADSERLRVRYESYKSLFEARRSALSYHKAEMKIL